MKKIKKKVNVAIRMLLPTIILLLASSCNDIYDNIQKYADSETIYADKLDGIIRIQTGYERIEIDLMEAGRIPANRIKMGKATKTVIECEDFEEEDHRRVIDSLCSWVDITGLTKLKTYQFTIYTEDDYGNRSLPLKAEGRPFTKENIEALSLASPSIVESSTTALLEWKDPLSTKIYTIYRYNYEFTDKDGTVYTGGGDGDLPSFFVENIVKGVDVPVKLKLRTIPTIINPDGTYTPILDSIWWEPTVTLRISDNAKPAIFLKTPTAATSIDVNDRSVFPLVFSWTTIPETSDYVLKISGDPSFPETEETFKLSVGSTNEYVVDETAGLSIINSFPKSRLKELYWTVVPAIQDLSITTQIRKIIASRMPQLIGKWTFDNITDLNQAVVGNDLIPVGDGFVSVEGPTSGDKAVKISKGSYYKCLHGMDQKTGNYTIMLYMKYSDTGIHAMVQTDVSNMDAAEFMINANGNPGVEGVGYSPPRPSPYSIGPGCWHRIFIVANNGSYKIYLNGELAYTGSSTDSRYFLDPEGVLLFADGFDKDNEMEVAEVVLWDLALEESEMLLYNKLKRVNRGDLSIAGFSSETAGAGSAINAIDGSLTGNPWYTGAEPPQWIVVDMGKTRDIGRVVVYTSTWGSANFKTLQLLTGMDQTHWNFVGELTRGGPDINPYGAITAMEFPDKTVNARYLKLNISEQYVVMPSIGEVIIYEKEN